MAVTTAVHMALSVGIDPKTFRSALRREKFDWHSHNEEWEVEIGSAQHTQMINILRSVFANTSSRS